MKIRTVILIILGILLVLAGVHFAVNTDWVALFKSMHNPPKH